MATLVKFVKDKDGDCKGEITAVFPQLKWNRRQMGNDTVTCYAHLGQHSAAHIEWVKECTEPAAPAEYAPLKSELESIGYNLKICK